MFETSFCTQHFCTSILSVLPFFVEGKWSVFPPFVCLSIVLNRLASHRLFLFRAMLRLRGTHVDGRSVGWGVSWWFSLVHQAAVLGLWFAYNGLGIRPLLATMLFAPGSYPEFRRIPKP